MKRNPLKDYGEKCCPTCTRVLPLKAFNRMRECGDCRAARGTPRTMRCSGCGEDKPAAEFVRDTNSSTGLYYKCKACERARIAAYRAVNPDRNKATAQRAYERRKALHRMGLVTMPEEKTCTECKKTKPAAAFYSRVDAQDGLTNRCIECYKAYSKMIYRRNRAKVLTHARRFRAESGKAVYAKNRAKVLQRRLNVLLGKTDGKDERGER